MRKYAFILSILGILTLLSLALFLPPKQISSPSELPLIISNQKIQVTGRVFSQNAQTIKLDNDISLSCPDCPNYKNKTISAICTINQYNNRTYLEVLRMKIIN